MVIAHSHHTLALSENKEKTVAFVWKSEGICLKLLHNRQK